MSGPRRRKRGEIATPPSSLRVKAYAGVDSLSGKQIFLPETIPPGPTAGGDAEKARTRLAAQVDERRSPRTKPTVNNLRA